MGIMSFYQLEVEKKMLNITAKISSNVFYRARSKVAAHMRKMPVAEFQKYLLRKGCCITGNIEDVKAFIRKKYPGFTEAGITNVVNDCVICIEW